MTTLPAKAGSFSSSTHSASAYVNARTRCLARAIDEDVTHALNELIRGRVTFHEVDPTDDPLNIRGISSALRIARNRENMIERGIDAQDQGFTRVGATGILGAELITHSGTVPRTSEVKLGGLAAVAQLAQTITLIGQGRKPRPLTAVKAQPRSQTLSTRRHKPRPLPSRARRTGRRRRSGVLTTVATLPVCCSGLVARVLRVRFVENARRAKASRTSSIKRSAAVKAQTSFCAGSKGRALCHSLAYSPRAVHLATYTSYTRDDLSGFARFPRAAPQGCVVLKGPSTLIILHGSSREEESASPPA